MNRYFVYDLRYLIYLGFYTKAHTSYQTIFTFYIVCCLNYVWKPQTGNLTRARRSGLFLTYLFSSTKRNFCLQTPILTQTFFIHLYKWILNFTYNNVMYIFLLDLFTQYKLNGSQIEHLVSIYSASSCTIF